MVLGVLTFSSSVNSQVETRSNDAGPIWDRVNLADAAVRTIEDRPLFGLGWREFVPDGQQYFRLLPDIPQQGLNIDVHNIVLSIGAELGLVGLTLWLVVVATTIVAPMLRRAPPELEDWRMGLIAVGVQAGRRRHVDAVRLHLLPVLPLDVGRDRGRATIRPTEVPRNRPRPEAYGSPDRGGERRCLNPHRATACWPPRPAWSDVTSLWSGSWPCRGSCWVCCLGFTRPAKYQAESKLLVGVFDAPADAIPGYVLAAQNIAADYARVWRTPPRYRTRSRTSWGCRWLSSPPW